jgi:ferrochelatase
MLPEGHPPVRVGKIGLLLVNLGSPDAPETAAVRRYLNQFLSDRRVVEIPPIVWQPILKGIILNTRPAKSAANYAKIWDRETNESPLKRITREQAQALEGAFGDQVIVRHAMRYGSPSMESTLAALRETGCDRIFVAPLYPQYCGATTGSVLDELFRILHGQRWLPALRTLEPYHDNPAYISALAASLRRHLVGLDFAPERVVLSFHGMPRRTLDLGDPYHCHCLKTARLLRVAMGMDEAEMPVGFQSRFGKAEWLQPYVQPMVEEMARSGVKRVAMMMPGFAADCVETLEEIAMEVRDAFLAAGGTHFAAIPCLNTSAEGLDMLRSILGQGLSGWAD